MSSVRKRHKTTPPTDSAQMSTVEDLTRRPQSTPQSQSHAVSGGGGDGNCRLQGKRFVVDLCRDVNCRLRLPLYARGGPAGADSNASGPGNIVRDNSRDSGMGGSNNVGSGSGGGACTDSPSFGTSSLAGRLLARLQSVHRRAMRMDFTVTLSLDVCTWLLFALSLATRFYKLSTPSSVVFDELHYGKYVSHYMRRVFFFDQHPPLGKQLIAAAAHLAGYDGNYTFPRIGAPYTANVPVFALRFVPALSGSALAPLVYKLLLEARLTRWSALLGGLMIVCDNALLTQSRFVLMEPMLLLFCSAGIYCLMRFQGTRIHQPLWWVYGIGAAVFLTCATSVKYVGFFTTILAGYMLGRYLWEQIYDAEMSDFRLIVQALMNGIMFVVVPLLVYLSLFFVHLAILHRAGPHDSVMTSAFQASLDGGLASITRGQPSNVVHGSQITLRHTHGRTCWLHSHVHVYPVRYTDKRGSSHQQQVTCYSFKDVNNWWIVKRPDRDDLMVDDELEPIRDGDVIQLVHGLTSRALNSHDVAAPMTPQCQEVSCYIDYQIKMQGEMLWRVQILNKETEGPVWKAIRSEVRLIHETTKAALRFSGRQLPDWAYNQHEVVADRNIEHRDAVWNVEEHRYTLTKDQRERERQLLNAEMIPTQETNLSFWQKFIELQTKMIWNSKHVQSHMYGSEPLEWPLLTKGIAYWVDTTSNGQIHLLGNIVIWYTATAGLIVYIALGVFYMLRRRRCCYDLPPAEWSRFLNARDYFFLGYLIHYLPYFFMERTLFLHNYLPALVFKICLLCYVIDHCDYLLRRIVSGASLSLVKCSLLLMFRFAVIGWLLIVVRVFCRFLPISYGVQKLSSEEVIDLRWKDSWDFILQKNYPNV